MDQKPNQQGGAAPQWSPDGRWWWDGQRWIPVQPNMAPPPRKVSGGRKALLAVTAGLLLLLMGVCTLVVASSGSQKAPSARAARSSALAPSAAPIAAGPTRTPQAASTPQVLLDLAGSGTKNSVEFTAPAHWTLRYSYDCSNFGTQGNFQVFVEQGSTPIDVPVNDVGAKGDSSTDVYRGGRVHLAMNSECSWHVTATT